MASWLTTWSQSSHRHCRFWELSVNLIIVGYCRGSRDTSAESIVPPVGRCALGFLMAFPLGPIPSLLSDKSRFFPARVSVILFQILIFPSCPWFLFSFLILGSLPCSQLMCWWRRPLAKVWCMCWIIGGMSQLPQHCDRARTERTAAVSLRILHTMVQALHCISQLRACEYTAEVVTAIFFIYIFQGYYKDSLLFVS